MSRSASTSNAHSDAVPDWAAELSPREYRFVEEYIVDLNGKAAAIRAGLGKTPKSATEIASRMRRKLAVAAAISKLMAERSGATESRIVEELGNIAFANLADFVRIEKGALVVTDTAKLSKDQQAAICEITETVNEHGRTLKVKLCDKVAALDRLAKVLTMYRERVELSGPNGGPVQIEDAKARLAEMIGIARDLSNDAKIVEILPPTHRLTRAPMPAVGAIIDAE